MKYLHKMVIAYEFNHNGTLVLHIKFKDDIPNEYTPAELYGVKLSNTIAGQEIWGTVYDHGHFIYPVFDCEKEKGRNQMKLKVQTATTGQEYVEENAWHIDDPYVWCTSTVEEV